jgi:hypothetical protein
LQHIEVMPEVTRRPDAARNRKSRNTASVTDDALDDEIAAVARRMREGRLDQS